MASDPKTQPSVPTWALLTATAALAFLLGAGYVVFWGAPSSAPVAPPARPASPSGRAEPAVDAGPKAPPAAQPSLTERPGRKAPYTRAVREWATRLSADAALRLYADAADLTLKYYARPLTVREFFSSGLDALREAAVTPGAEASFAGLDDAQKRGAWQEAIGAVRKRCEDTAEPTDANTTKWLQALFAANDASVMLPQGIVVYECLNGALKRLDPGCGLLTPGDLHELSILCSSRFAGVGIEWTMKDRVPVVDEVYHGGPAWHAGVRVGDRILAVAGKPTAGSSAYELANRLRGKPDTAVTLALARPSAQGGAHSPVMPVQVTVKRRTIELSKVEASQLLDPERGIAYLRLRRFQKGTTIAVLRELRRLKGEGMRGLVLDLRGSSGSDLRAAAGVADLFMAERKIVELKGRAAGTNRTIRAASRTLHGDTAIAALVDSTTRAAAEILAGALKENERATLFGSRTPGRGSLQKIFQLQPHGVALRLTICHFHTPSGAPIEGAGVAPNVAVASGAIKPRAGTAVSASPLQEGPLVKAALQFLRQKLPSRKALHP